MWITDGRTTTELLAGSQGVYDLNPTSLVVVSTRLLFEGNDASGNIAEWSSDGTAAGTIEVSTHGSLGMQLLSTTDPAGDFDDHFVRDAAFVGGGETGCRCRPNHRPVPASIWRRR